MAHDYLKHSIEHQTGRTGALLIAALVGGILVLNSFVAEWLFAEPANTTGEWSNPYSALFGLAGALLLGGPLIFHAARHLLQGQMHMDALVAVAVIAAMAMEMYQEAGVIAFFVIVSNLIETRTALGARASIESLIRLTPTRACRLDSEGHEEVLEAGHLVRGDHIRVRPGDNIPADGLIIRGETTVNQANITGESMPAEKQVGDEVFNGTNNLTGAIDIRVTKAGADSTLGQVQRLILQAEATRIPAMRIVDQYAGWYMPTIIMLACMVLFFTRDMSRAISMLVVACPCAIVLATPTAMVAALSCAARLGVLVKNVVNLESAKDLTAIIFDKTGTLTTGQLSVTQMLPAPDVDGASLLRSAASAEQMSRHPVARAVVEVARKARLRLELASSFQEVPGLGVAASVNGDEILVGRAGWLEKQGADMSLLENPTYREPDGLSTLYVVRNGRCLGWIGMEDRARPEARQAMAELRELGIRILMMVTGDRWSVARRIGEEMGCTQVQAEVLPDQKLDVVEGLKTKGHRVAVIGDGVNDAPALAAGHLGIAMGAAGSDVAINSASIALMNSDLSRLPFLLRLSRATSRIIWQNIGFAITYIIVLELCAATGYLSPMLAAALHTLAGAIVIFNSARLVRFGEHLAPAPVVSSGAVPRRSAEPPQVLSRSTAPAPEQRELEAVGSATS